MVNPGWRVEGGVRERKYRQIGKVVVGPREYELWQHPTSPAIRVMRDPETGVETKWLEVSVDRPKPPKEAKNLSFKEMTAV